MRFSAILLLLFAACASQPTPSAPPCVAGHALIHAVLWIQSAAEYDAAARQAYNSARRQLDTALTAPGDKPPAVILDVDETAVDNSAFEARMIRQGKVYSAEEWRKWVDESAAGAVPGALEFLTYARSRGVTPFYITNRKGEEEPATRENLRRLGYPLTANEDVVLTRGERPEWESGDKEPRRQWVASRYRVLVVLGDDLNDFIPAAGRTREQRDELVRGNAQRWGTEWIMVPNPMYGSWEQAVTGGASGCEALQKKIEALRP